MEVEAEENVPSGDVEEASSDVEEYLVQDLQALLEKQRENQKENKDYINNVAGLEQKLSEIEGQIIGYDNRASVPWAETLDLLDDTPLPEIDTKDDLTREKEFYNHALRVSQLGLKKLKDLDIPYRRPDDFFAEMLKTDEHMTKVKNTMLQEKRHIDEAIERRRLRTQKQFGKKLQIEKQQQRAQEKKSEIETIKKWRKSRKGNNTNDDDADFPVDLLDSNSELRKELEGKSTTPTKGRKDNKSTTPRKGDRGGDRGDRGGDRDNKRGKKSKAQIKRDKYGFGGKKKFSKSNTAESNYGVNVKFPHKKIQKKPNKRTR
eukprot:TRINITY_DN3084_c0_g1_i1.p1 TRINITY_DN3084_c0_g1~~TRINITY_DN3084_c0_g1_i1.p1  ORF type:complete len:332 (+),score=120.90 TRINITY_DN3084_c0_g1_i1:44-997(+)